MINVLTDPCACVVVLLSLFVYAIVTVTVLCEILLGVIMEQDPNVTFDLLGGRPIDLAVLLQALLVLHNFLILFPTLSLAAVVVNTASFGFTMIPLTRYLLKVCLNHIALDVSLHENFVCSRARAVQRIPPPITGLELGDHASQPAPVCFIDSSIAGFAFTRDLLVTVPEIWGGACHWSALFCSVDFFIFNIETGKASTLLRHVNIFGVNPLAALPVSCRQLFRFSCELVTNIINGVLVLGNATAKTILCEAAEVLLVNLVAVP
jgi:hypothetical protein